MRALEYTRELVAFPSVSSVSNAEIAAWIEQRLQSLGFEIERLEYIDGQGVRKVTVLGKLGSGTGGMAHFSHSDVVPADNWARNHGPFEPTVEGDRLYGRGSCDMKGSLACALAAVEQFSASRLSSPVYIVCTSDEEVGMIGAQHVARRSEMFQEMVSGGTCGIIGEPTELDVVHGHKGGTVIRIVSHGRAAHSSTTEGLNANLAMIPFLSEMKAIHDETISDPKWQNQEFDPPTLSWNIGINDHTHAINITPPQSVCTVYFRKMPGIDTDPLVERVLNKAEECGLEAEVTDYGKPLYVDPHSAFVRECLELTGRQSPRTVAYGTDGALLGALNKLVVIGPGSIRQAHTEDEWITLDQLEQGTEVYQRMIERWCC